jgi:hypothetical protein
MFSDTVSIFDDEKLWAIYEVSTRGQFAIFFPWLHSPQRMQSQLIAWKWHFAREGSLRGKLGCGASGSH